MWCWQQYLSARHPWSTCAPPQLIYVPAPFPNRYLKHMHQLLLLAWASSNEISDNTTTNPRDLCRPSSGTASGGLVRQRKLRGVTSVAQTLLLGAGNQSGMSRLGPASQQQSFVSPHACPPSLNLAFRSHSGALRRFSAPDSNALTKSVCATGALKLNNQHAGDLHGHQHPQVGCNHPACAVPAGMLSEHASISEMQSRYESGNV